MIRQRLGVYLCFTDSLPFLNAKLNSSFGVRPDSDFLYGVTPGTPVYWRPWLVGSGVGLFVIAEQILEAWVDECCTVEKLAEIFAGAVVDHRVEGRDLRFTFLVCFREKLGFG